MRTTKHRTAKWLHTAALVCLLLPAASLVADAAKSLRAPLLKLVGQVQHADYAGDRPALQKLYVEMGPYVDDTEVSATARYWRGFALWRRALNGFNDPSTDPKDLEHDLTRAIEEFKATVAADPQFVDAKIAIVSCQGNLMYLSHDQEHTQALLNEMLPVLKEVQAAAPDNPRLLWVRGPQLWYLGEERGGGEEKAFATYEKGLELVRKQKAGDPLQPSWGEAELLMNLAWSNLHRKKPDLEAADQYAHQALQIVPYWHYVRDILLPQIQDAKKAAGGHSSP
jgi:tetratricopeptide (TPR) repeat protein